MEKVNYIVTILIIAILLVSTTVTSLPTVETEEISTPNTVIMQNASELELPKHSNGYFTANQGQWSSELGFVAATQFGQLGLGKGCIYLNLIETAPDEAGTKGCVIKLTFVDSNLAVPFGIDPLPHSSNFFYGNDPAKWATKVGNYKMVIYENLWDDIDLRYYLSQAGPKYEFVLHPGAVPEDIRIQVEGQDALETFGSELAIRLPNDQMVYDKDLRVFYGDNSREMITASFEVINRDTYCFDLADYDKNRAVVIDPLVYATYLGGTNGETGHSIDYDPSGNAYVTGIVRSTDFPTTPGCWDDTYNTDWDVFVTKFDAMGSTLLYSTYVGGDLAETGYGIDIDSDGNAYVTGYTYSTDFPYTLSAYDTTHNGDKDVFVFELDAAGSNLLYSTYIGGTFIDTGLGITLDSSNNTYITGYTTSTTYPVASPFDATHNDGEDAFISKLNPTGTSLLYSTFIGGGDDERGNDIILDSNREMYIVGETASNDFPMGIFGNDTTYNGGDTDAFVLRMNLTGGFLLYSTYVGGSDSDHANAIAIDASQNAYVTGETKSPNFPITPSAYDNVYKGGGIYEDVYVFKIDNLGTTYSYSTFVSGTHNENAYGIAIDSMLNTYVTGYSHSTDFPTTSDAMSQTIDGSRDIILFELDTTGSSLVYSTFFGGGSLEAANDLALDNNLNAYVTGWTWSTDFPVTPGANDTSYNTNEDAYVFKFQFQEMLSAPRGLTADVGNGYIQLNWSAPASSGDTPIAGYKIYRGLSSGTEGLLDSIGVATGYNDTTITNGVIYYYYVTAENATSESDPSSEVRVADEERPRFWTDNTQTNPTTGDGFTFSIAALDNVLVTSVYVDHWYGDGTHTNTSMVNTAGLTWELDITIIETLETLHYIFYADDPSSNWNLTHQNNLPVLDNDQAVFVTDTTTTSATTGDSFEFEVEVTDNIAVDSVWVEYWFGAGPSSNNVTMNKIEDNFWNHIISIPSNSLDKLYYIFHANDSSDNWNASLEIERLVLDNDAPYFLNETTDPNATTGDSFTFRITASDNIEVAEVWVEYWYGMGTRVNVSMTQVYGIDYYHTITIEDTLEDLKYLFHAKDTSLKWNETQLRSYNVYDNDKPFFVDFSPPATTNTGDEYSISVSVTDNIEVHNVSAEYWFGAGEHTTIPLTEIIGLYQDKITVPSDSLHMLNFKIISYDTSYNMNSTSTYSIMVIDSIPPIIETPSDLTVTQNEVIDITIEASDNICIVEVAWTNTPFAPEWLTLEGVVDVEDEYAISITVSDAAGNTAIANFTLTVEAVGGDNDRDGDGYPNTVDAFPDDPDYHLDTDNDGMADAWEDRYNFDKNDPSDAAGDLDGDGKSNLEEFTDGTDPTSKKSDSEADWFIWIIIIVVIVVIVLVVMVLSLKKKKEPEVPQPQVAPPLAPGQELTTIAAPEVVDKTIALVDYPAQQQVIEQYPQEQHPAQVPPMEEGQPPGVPAYPDQPVMTPPPEQPLQMAAQPDQPGLPPPEQAPSPAAQLPPVPVAEQSPEPGTLPPEDTAPPPTPLEEGIGTLPSTEEAVPPNTSPEGEPTQQVQKPSVQNDEQQQ